MTEPWQHDLAEAYTSLEELQAAGLLSAGEAARLHPVASAYRIRVPRYYAGLMDRAHLAGCPVRAQAIPHEGEIDPTLPAWAEAWSQRAFGRATPWCADPIGDLTHLAAPRLTHRYRNRALLHVSPACALYCRFCFRKTHLNHQERELYGHDLTPALAYLQAHREIRELVLTGGDPLSMPDRGLAALFTRLASVAHLRQVRIHSRMPVTLPRRLTDALAALLRDQPFGVALVAHFNHPRECTRLALARLRQLRRAGVILYNQSVMLRGINDRTATLQRLWQRLYEAGVTPFYVHHADWTPGTFHFRVPLGRAWQLMAGLCGRLSGPALPRLVVDLPGGQGKVPADRSFFRAVERRHEGSIAGTLYEVRRPRTRSRQLADTPTLYCDLWRCS